MKKSLYTALGLAVALAVSAPVLSSGANAAAATSTTSATTANQAMPKHHVKKVHKTTTKKVPAKPAATTAQ